MAKYQLDIEFRGHKNCYECPVRDINTDSCRIQLRADGEPIEFEDWKTQMANCPLKHDDRCQNAEKLPDDKCRGYQKSQDDDEPSEVCKECVFFVLFQAD